ncbi:MAG: hypothetical protein JRJ70_06160, partial [Deltaproteobacteria bacterium]|nr:hypothetical protein [Deltaproteobacteria bacterium]
MDLKFLIQKKLKGLGHLMSHNHDFKLARERMVKNQLIARGITDERVLQAMGKIPRHRFIEEAL